MKFSLSGKVTPYEGNGRKLGYPTANIPVSVETEEGIFVGTVLLHNKKYPALIFVGAPITLNDDVKRAEAHILDFKDRDLYGEQVVFEIEKKIRNNEKFDTVDGLLEQMKQDEVDARAHFKGRI